MCMGVGHAVCWLSVMPMLTFLPCYQRLDVQGIHAAAAAVCQHLVYQSCAVFELLQVQRKGESD